jgi:hypothetical protein
MDYLEAELEARIFPSVDLDPRDWEEEDMFIMPGNRNDNSMTDEELDEQFDNEPDNVDPWGDVISVEE